MRKHSRAWCRAMSLTRWFKRSDTSSPKKDEKVFEAAAEAVEAVLEAGGALGGRKRKSVERHRYSDSDRTKIGRFALMNGNKRAIEKYSRALGFALPEATVRNFKREVQKQLKDGKDIEDVKVGARKRGRPILLPEEIDDLVKKFVQNLRICGTPVSASIVLAAAQGIVIHKDRSLLQEYGGSLALKKSWAYSFLGRHGYVKRKSTRTARKIPADFQDIKSAFITRVQETVRSNNIPLQMVVNFDQTGTKMVPVSDWTLEVQGTKQIDMIASDDKREVTVLLAVSLSGELLPPQVIYAGKTERCHPSVIVPQGWNVTHSPSHWSTKDTMVEYAEKILLPYMEEQRQKLDLQEDAPGLCIFDVFAAHRCEEFTRKLEEGRVKYVFVPAGCTGLLQPLDISVNEPFKQNLKKIFGRWYAEKVKKSLDRDNSVDNVHVDLKTSVIKPVHFQWLIENYCWLAQQEGPLIRGWKESGILECFGGLTIE